MKRKKILLLAMVVVTLWSLPFNAYANVMFASIPLQVRIWDPEGEHNGPHRTPTETPEVTLDDHTLSFDASCHGCTLRLVNADNEVEYTTVITSSTLVLPSTLDGTYELQIIQGEWCFYGDIEQ